MSEPHFIVTETIGCLLPRADRTFELEHCGRDVIALWLDALKNAEQFRGATEALRAFAEELRGEYRSPQPADAILELIDRAIANRTESAWAAPTRSDATVSAVTGAAPQHLPWPPPALAAPRRTGRPPSRRSFRRGAVTE